MAIAVVLVVLVAATLSTAYLTRSTFGVALPSVIFSIALALYVFSLVNALFVGLVVVLVAIAALATVAIVRRGPRRVLSAIPSAFSPALVLFIVFAVASFVLTRFLQLGNWDEFSHWGASVKAVVIDNAIAPYNPIDLAFRSYPPAMTMFEYFGLKLSGGWSESNLFWSYQVMFASLFFPFVSDVRWAWWRRLLVVVPLMALTPVLIFNAFQGVLVDPFLGLLFGYCLALVFTGDTRSRSLRLGLSLGLAMLVLTKDSGFFLGIFVLVLFAAKAIRQREPGSLRSAIAGVLRALAAPTLALAAAYVSWKIILAVLKVPAVFAEPINLVRLVDGTAPAYWNDVIAAFGRALFVVPINSPYWIPLPHLGWFVLCAIALVALELVRRRRGERFDFTATIVVLVGAVLYTVGLLVLYLFRFGDYEAVRLASFDRYLGTYWAGVAMLLSLAAIRLVVEQGWPRNPTTARRGPRALPAGTAFALAWLLVVVILTPVRPLGGFVIDTLIKHREPRASIAEAQAVRAAGVTDTDRVWVISEFSTGLEYWQLRYELMPTRVNDGYWSLGTPQDDADVWTADVSPAKWAAQLRDYDYVFIDASSASFVRAYGSLFENPDEVADRTLFAVRHDGSEVVLEKVP